MPIDRVRLKTKLLHMVMDEEFLAALDDYQFAHRYRTRTEAVRAILRKALDEDAAVRRPRVADQP